MTSAVLDRCVEAQLEDTSGNGNTAAVAGANADGVRVRPARTGASGLSLMLPEGAKIDAGASLDFEVATGTIEFWFRTGLPMQPPAPTG